MAHNSDLEAEYRAVRAGTGIMARSHEARLRVRGRDRTDLLHRMSTNDLTGMQTGEARPTVFTTAVARIIDLVWVLNRTEDLLLLCSPGQGDTLRRWLAGYIFFQDEVALQDVSEELGQFGIFGPRAVEIAAALNPAARGLSPGRFVEHDDCLILRARPLAGDGFTVVAPRPQMAERWETAVGAGGVPFGEEVYQILRIEAGQAQPGREISPAYIPLEAGLWPAVSFSKGCYIGQEIIARMESRGRLAKTLVGLKGLEPLPEGGEVRVNGDAVGEVSSAVISPTFGPIGLAFVKPVHAAPGTRATVTAGEQAIPVEVVEIPFG